MRFTDSQHPLPYHPRCLISRIAIQGWPAMPHLPVHITCRITERACLCRCYPDAIPSFSSAVSGDEVGRSVALSDNGTVMATGAPGSVPTTGGKDQG